MPGHGRQPGEPSFDLRQTAAGEAPEAGGMDQLPDGTLFRVFRRMIGTPLNATLVAVVVLALLAFAILAR
jgi:hypothetical protein